MPPGTLGFRVDGRIERSDYVDVLEPPLRRAIESGERLRTLFEVGGLEGVGLSAMLEDLKVGAQLGIEHRSAWERIALVTDADWVRRGAELLGWMMPGEVKLFPAAELDQAKAWIAG